MKRPTAAAVVLVGLLLALAQAPAGAEELSGIDAGTDGAADVIANAVAISQERFPDPDSMTPGTPIPAWAVLSRTGVFADSLGGASLTGAGPLLFTDPGTLPPETVAELDRLFEGDGERVYLLGGEAAISAGIEQQLDEAGYTTIRLAGPSRVETSLAVADEVSEIGGAGRIALARADGPADNPTASWADSLTGGGWAANQVVPVILTPTDALHPAVAAYIQQRTPETVVLLGGEAALSSAVEAAVPNPVRISGANRYQTAVAVATELWTEPSGSYLITSGNAIDGWAYGLAGAGLGATTAAPLLLVETDRLPAEIDQLLCQGGTRAATTVIGGLDIVSQAVRDALDSPC